MGQRGSPEWNCPGPAHEWRRTSLALRRPLTWRFETRVGLPGSLRRVSGVIDDRRHSFRPQFGQRFFALAQVAHSHATQNVVCLRVLNLRIGHDLYPVSPRVEKVEETTVEKFDSHGFERAPRQLLVVDSN